MSGQVLWVAGVDVTPWEGFSPFDEVLEGAGDLAGGVIKSGFEYIVNSLFGGAPAELTLAVLRWLVAIPDFSGGAVGELERTMSVVALALLACVMTISVARFWGAGLASGGSAGFAGLEGVGRGVVAVCAIAVWPFAFEAFSEIAGAVSGAVLSSEQMKRDIATVLASGVGIGTLPGIGLLFGIVIAVVGTVLLLALVGMKIVVSALSVIVFCGAPIAFVLWVIPELGWIATTLMRVLCAVLAIPLVWALVFATFGALWSDTLLFRNGGKGEELGFAGSLADAALVKPMVAVALLYLAVVVPKRLVAMAPLVGGGRGPLGAVRSMGTHAALHRAMPYAPGGGRGLAAAAGRGAGAEVGAGGAVGAVGGLGGARAGAVGGGTVLGGVAGGAAAHAGAASGAASVAGAAGSAGGAGAAAAAGVTPRDRYGGPKQAMTAERNEAIAQSVDRMRRMSDAERPDAGRIAAAHASLPGALRRAAARAATEAPSHEQARKALASWAAHPAGAEHREALETIGAGSQAAFREGVGASAASAPASGAGPAASGQPSEASRQSRDALARIPGAERRSAESSGALDSIASDAKRGSDPAIGRGGGASDSPRRGAPGQASGGDGRPLSDRRAPGDAKRAQSPPREPGGRT